MGPPVGGFPPKVIERVLRGEKPVDGRPGASMPPADFNAARDEIDKLVEGEPKDRDVISYLLYPEVFENFAKLRKQYSDLSVLPTPIAFYGLQVGEETAFEIEPGKTLIIKLLAIGEPNASGSRTVFFELNGRPREVNIVDASLESSEGSGRKASASDPNQVGAAMPGMVVNVAVCAGDKVVEGQKLVVLQAMKMETAVTAEQDAVVKEVVVEPGTQVETGDLLLVLES